MSILDRFLATRQGRAAIFDSSDFQLAAMTSLYTAVKIHEPEVMSAQLVATLSRGAHTEAEVKAMESRILEAVKWRVNPPTSLSFVRYLLELLPPEFLNQDTRSTLYEVSKYQTELVVADYSMVTVPASIIAYASLVNALEGVCMDRTALGYVCAILSQAAGVDVQSAGLAFVQRELFEAVSLQTTTQTSNGTTSEKAAPVAGGSSCGMVQRRSSYKASPCTVMRMEI